MPSTPTIFYCGFAGPGIEVSRAQRPSIGEHYWLEDAQNQKLGAPEEANLGIPLPRVVPGTWQ